MSYAIYSRNGSNTELSTEDLMRRAPAIFTEDKYESVSNRYAPVSTISAIEVLRDHNYVPVQASQVKSRKEGNLAYAQHFVAFSHIDDLFHGDRPEIILYNSHNAKSSLKLFAGFFRMVCSNGLIAGQGFESRMIHYNSSVVILEEVLGDITQKLPKLHDTIEMMKHRDLDGKEVWSIAEEAVKLRWDMLPQEYKPEELSGSYATGQTVSNIISPRRSEDAGRTLWQVYNRVQENLIRGGADILSFTDRSPNGGYRRAKAIRSVHDNLTINRGLWDIATKEIENV